MSDKEIGLGRLARAVDFAQYVKDRKEADEKMWAAERERIRLLNEADRKYNEQMEIDMKNALKKHLTDTLPAPGLGRTVSTGIDISFDSAKARKLAEDALQYLDQNIGAY